MLYGWTNVQGHLASSRACLLLQRYLDRIGKLAKDLQVQLNLDKTNKLTIGIDIFSFQDSLYGTVHFIWTGWVIIESLYILFEQVECVTQESLSNLIQILLCNVIM